MDADWREKKKKKKKKMRRTSPTTIEIEKRDVG
jgi:hypothetical protein